MEKLLVTPQKSILNSDPIFIAFFLLLLWVCTQRLANKNDRAQDEEGQEQKMHLMATGAKMQPLRGWNWPRKTKKTRKTKKNKRNPKHQEQEEVSRA